MHTRNPLSHPWAIGEADFRRIVWHALGDPFALAEITAPPPAPATVRDAVAVLEVGGPLFRSADAISLMLGATTYEQLAADFREALADPEIRGIVLEIDSPGGDALGLSALVDSIRAGRGAKPIASVIRGLGTSAAYSIASAADPGRVSAARDALVGGVGVVLSILDFSGFLEKEGIEQIEIVSSQSPRKHPDPKTADGRAQLQREVDAVAQVVIEGVASNRGVSVGTVLEHFGQGGVFVGEAAVDARLVDRIGTLDQAVEEVASGRAPAPATIGKRNSVPAAPVSGAPLASLPPRPEPSAHPWTWAELEDLAQRFRCWDLYQRARAQHDDPDQAAQAFGAAWQKRRAAQRRAADVLETARRAGVVAEGKPAPEAHVPDLDEIRARSRRPAPPEDTRSARAIARQITAPLHAEDRRRRALLKAHGALS